MITNRDALAACFMIQRTRGQGNINPKTVLFWLYPVLSSEAKLSRLALGVEITAEDIAQVDKFLEKYSSNLFEILKNPTDDAMIVYSCIQEPDSEFNPHYINSFVSILKHDM